MAGKKYNLDDAINIFFIESREMLQNMENSLLDLEKNFTDQDAIHSIFRAIHTIKGSAGMFGFREMEEFAHVVENILDKARNNEIEIEPDLISLFFDCHDSILLILDFIEGNRDAPLDDKIKTNCKNLIKRFDQYSESEIASSLKEEVEIPDKLDFISDQQVLNECWHISLRFKEDAFRNGFDPKSFIQYLNEMGKIENIIALHDSAPAFNNINPESCYMGFEIDFAGYTTKENIESAFEFLQDDCIIRILPPKSDITDYVYLIKDLPESTMFVGEMLRQIGSLTEHELVEALKLQKTLEDEQGILEAKRIGEIMVDEKMIQKPIVEAALDKQEQLKKASESVQVSIRINASKLDSLITKVGELVITGSIINQLSEESENNEMIESVSILTRLIDEIRDGSMTMRMVPIGESLKRLERIVRDISKANGKEVDFIIMGGETELDKIIIDKISDPLMHLVRNALDHGIDLPDEREAIGKSRKGKLILKAYHETGSIIIEVSDDGNGLSKEKILSKAIEKSLVTEEYAQSLSDSAVFQYIFEPGFSTAAKVTNISGRGVGMDVVKKNIDSLRGMVAINSTEGKGTTVRIQLPLTLAIINGFLIKAGALLCILPLEMVVECLDITREQARGDDQGHFFDLRGELIPFIRLREFFNEAIDESIRENIIIVEYARKKVGFVIDKSLGELQTVIKPLGKVFNKLQWISGATILGDGQIAFILDVARLIQYVQIINKKESKI